MYPVPAPARRTSDGHPHRPHPPQTPRPQQPRGGQTPPARARRRGRRPPAERPLGRRRLAARAHRRPLQTPRKRQQLGHRQPRQPPPVPLLLRLHQQRGRPLRTRRLPHPARGGLDGRHRLRRPRRLAGRRRPPGRRHGARLPDLRRARHVGADHADPRAHGRRRPRLRGRGRRAGPRRRPLRPSEPRPAPGAGHHAGAPGVRVPPPRRPGLRHRRPRGRPRHRRLRRPADGPPHGTRPARRRPRGPGGRGVARRHRPAAAADRPHTAGPQGTPARPQPDDHDGAVHGRDRLGHRRRRPR